MNERIIKLFAEAFDNLDYPFKQEINCPDILIEKFAELIVRECAKVVFDKTGPKSALNVLEHFGVEE